jgi:hypothetical protein
MLTSPLQGVVQQTAQQCPIAGIWLRMDLSNRTQLTDSEHQALESEFAKPLMFDETISLQHHSNRCTAKEFVSKN